MTRQVKRQSTTLAGWLERGVRSVAPHSLTRQAIRFGMGLLTVTPCALSLTPARAQSVGSPALMRFAMPAPRQASDEGTILPKYKESYEEAVKHLDKMAPMLDAETRASLPTLKAILRRWATGETLGPIEEQVIDAFDLQGRGGGTPLPSLDALKPKLHAATSDLSKQATKFQFKAVEGSVGGKKRGIVNLKVNEHDTVIVVVLSETARATPLQRAQTIKSRLEKLSVATPTWWSQMVVSQTGGAAPLYFVATKQHPNEPLITADPLFAREAGCEPPVLAKQLISSMRNVIVDSTRALDDPQTPAEKHWAAFLDMQEADKALTKPDEDRAEHFYKEAIGFDPNYVMPYLHLTELYLTGKTKKDKVAARAQIEAVKKLPTLKAADRKDIQSLEARLK